MQSIVSNYAKFVRRISFYNCCILSELVMQMLLRLMNDVVSSAQQQYSSRKASTKQESFEVCQVVCCLVFVTLFQFVTVLNGLVFGCMFFFSALCSSSVLCSHDIIVDLYHFSDNFYAYCIPLYSRH